MAFPEGKYGFFQSALNLAYKIQGLLQFPKVKRSAYEERKRSGIAAGEAVTCRLGVYETPMPYGHIQRQENMDIFLLPHSVRCAMGVRVV